MHAVHPFEERRKNTEVGLETHPDRRKPPLMLKLLGCQTQRYVLCRKQEVEGSREFPSLAPRLALGGRLAGDREADHFKAAAAQVQQRVRERSRLASSAGDADAGALFNADLVARRRSNRINHTGGAAGRCAAAPSHEHHRCAD